MSKIKVISALIFLALLGFLAFFYFSSTNNMQEFRSPIGNPKQEQEESSKPAEADLVDNTPLKISKDKPFSLLILGIDRRSKDEVGYRTDIMILMTINQDQKKVLLTSVPRDLWINGGRINATFTGGGWDAMQDAFEKVSGQRPTAYIQCDFEDLVWLVDAMGGLEVDLDNSFTDEEYPNDELKTYMTVSFEKGLQKIDGNSALILSRSRHGNNGEGSDFKRMERQHKILKAMPEAVLSSKSIFTPLNIPKFYQTITQGHLVTNLSLNDVKALWDFYSIRKEYQMESFYIASDYLINPPMSEYGGAWVLIAPNNDYSAIHFAINQKALLSPPTPEKIVSTHSQNDESEKASEQ